MKILILGSTGMLGTYLVKYFDEHLQYQCFAASRSGSTYQCNFKFLDDLFNTIDDINPDVVVNSVAMTSLVECNNNKAEALHVNGLAPIEISRHCKQRKIKYIQISSDHFYSSNDGIRKHTELDKTIILNEYARGKLLAERGIVNNNSEALIIRTAILGRTNQNRSLLDWMLTNIINEQEVSLLFNVFSSAIHCKSLCKLLEELLKVNVSGIYNVGTNSVFSYGTLYLEIANYMGIQPRYKILDFLDDGITRSTNRGLSIKKLKKIIPIIPSYEDLIAEIIDEE